MLFFLSGALSAVSCRVMAVARGKREDSLVFCGLVGIMDPPRASAIAFAERMQVRWPQQGEVFASARPCFRRGKHLV